MDVLFLSSINIKYSTCNVTYMFPENKDLIMRSYLASALPKGIYFSHESRFLLLILLRLSVRFIIFLEILFSTFDMTLTIEDTSNLFRYAGER